MNDKIKKVICNYLVKDLYKVEIIYYRDSIWFIDRESRYWYFEYHKVDKHLWWRWSHFTQALKIFSMDAEKEQSIFGELVNIILTKKQKLESKYPNKIFKTIGSVMNFEDNDGVVTKNEIKTTDGHGWKPRFVVDDVLNCEVETTRWVEFPWRTSVDEVLNCEVETTAPNVQITAVSVDEVLNCEVGTTDYRSVPNEVMLDDVLNNEVKTTHYNPLNNSSEVDEVLNCEVETTRAAVCQWREEVDKVLNCEVETTKDTTAQRLSSVDEVLNFEVETTQSAMGSADVDVSEILDFSSETTVAPNALPKRVVEKVLNYEVETTNPTDYAVEGVIEEALNYNIKTIEQDWYKSPQLIDDVLYPKTTEGGELIDEDKLISDVLEIQNIQPTERGSDDRMLDFVLDVEDYQAWDGKQKTKVNEVLTQSPKLIEKQYDVDVVLDNTVEINSIEKQKGDNPFRDIIVGHILDESDKVTDKLKIKEGDYVKTYSHDVYMCDHLVQNVLDVGVNSIHYDAEPHTPLIDGILKKV